MVTRLRHTLYLFILTAGLSALMPVHAADIIARTDRVTVGMEESFTLTFETKGNVDDDPDFSPLQQDFQIISNNQSSNFSFINGRTESSKTWTLQLFPKRSGELVIPAIGFGQDQSPELRITVQQQAAGTATSDKDIFIEVEVDTQKPYIQQQVLYTARLYRAVATGDDQLSNPEPGNQDAIIDPFGDNRNYDKVINGRHYNVHERRFVIFPQREGILHIPPVMYTGRVGGQRSLFDPFTRGRSVRVLSDPVRLDVQAIPAQFHGTQWLPAKNLAISESWSPDPPQFKAGEPVTQSITLSAIGLTAAQLPELPAKDIDGLKQYPDQPALDDIVNAEAVIGRRTEKRALIPTAAGRYTLPEIEIPWWNTDTQTAEIARLPARTIEVLAADGKAAQAAPAGESDQPAAANNSDQAVGAAAAATAETSAGVWPWLSLLLAILWGITAWLYWQQRNRLQQLLNPAPRQQAASRPLPERKQVLQQLEHGCRHHDMQQTKQALLQWAQLQWPQSDCNNLSTIADKTGGTLAQAIGELNAALYRGTTGTWQGDALWQAFSNWTPPVGAAKPAPALADLHRI